MSSERNPKVSVLMCVYNGEKYLREAIESVLQQSYTDFEYVIVNDGSTDRSEEIILSYNDPRIVYVKNEINLRLQASLNKGLSISKGSYIARMDADDICMPDRFRQQVGFLESNPRIGVIGTAAILIDGNGVESETILFPSDPLIIQWSLFFTCVIAHPTVMARKQVLENAGGYDASLKHAEDYDLWLRLVMNTGFYNIQNVLLKLRKHESNASLDLKNLLSQAVTISANAIEKITGKHVSKEILYNFSDHRKLKNATERVTMARYFFDVYEELVINNTLTANDKNLLKKYVTDNAIQMLKPCIWDIQSLLMIAGYFFHNPVFFLQKLYKKVL